MSLRGADVGKWCALVAGAVGALLAVPQAAGPQSESPTASVPAGLTSTEARATLDRYCVSCHSDRLKTGGLTLQGIDLAMPAAHAESLEKVVKKLRLGSMPPIGMPRPEPKACIG
jgi:mono/diheme cytochrome c family protein